MEQSMIAAVSGIDANQTYLNVIGNNIANADTVGFKAQNVVFTDLLAEQIAGASAAPPDGQGAGTNPITVGAGVRVGAVSSSLTEGSLEQTGVSTDVAIDGNGYFVIEQNGQQLYTRAGNLTVDGDGNLATQTGGLILGWQASATGVVDTTGPLTGITIPTGQLIPATATTDITMNGNLPAWGGTGVPPVVTTTITGYDGQGQQIPVTFTFTGVAGAANKWSVQGTVPDGTGSTNLWTAGSEPVVTFDPSDGQISSVSGSTTNGDGSLSLAVDTMPTNYSFPTGDTWSIDFPKPGTNTAVTQFAGEQTLQAVKQNGNASGTLESFSIGSTGLITGSFSNGQTESIGQLALGNFANANGLADMGNSTFAATPNSGRPIIGAPGTNGLGSLIGGSLEVSNVDLAKQLTDMIQAQENYQANTKVITTTNTVLQSLMTIQ